MLKLKLKLFLFISTSALAIPPISISGTKRGNFTGIPRYTSGISTIDATTSHLPEGTNLYYTDARVKTAAAAGTAPTLFYVDGANGSDANNCSILKPCKTIQAGVTAAEAVAAYYKQAIVFVAPHPTSSVYTENVTMSQQGVNLMCMVNTQNSRACTIKGTLTINLTGTSGGGNFVAGANEVYVQGFVISKATSGDSVVFSGTTFQRLTIVDSYIDNTGTGSAMVASNNGTSGGTASTITSHNTDWNNGNASNATINISAGRMFIYGTTNTVSNGNASGKSLVQSGGTFICTLCQLTGQAQITSNTAFATFNLSTISSGTASCIETPSSPNTGYVIISSFGCTSTNTNSITGTGVVVLGGGSARLSSSGDIVGTVTQAVFPGFPQGEMLLGTNATTGTNVILSMRGGHVKMAQATGPTSLINANAGTGGSPACTLSNHTDMAGKIALTTGTSAWALGTQCTITFNKAYAVAPICVFSPNNDNAAANAVALKVNFTTTTTTMIVRFGAADVAQTTYNWMYNCMETQ